MSRLYKKYPVCYFAIIILNCCCYYCVACSFSKNAPSLRKKNKFLTAICDAPQQGEVLSQRQQCAGLLEGLTS